MSRDPWTGIATPSTTAMVSSRRISAENKWDFFWAKDHTGRCLLLLQHAVESTTAEILPKPKGLTVELWDAAPGRKTLALRLLETSQRDIFLKLATDIVSAADAASSEPEAVAATLARTWRWHHLLKGGSGGKLGDEEQKGLIGELLVLKRHLLPSLSPSAAIGCWVGPLGAPKDFEVGRLAIEAKARRGSATPFIKISSEHQLDDSGCDCLLLHVVELDRLPTDNNSHDAMSLSTLVAELRGRLEASDRVAAEAFDASLAAAGLRSEDNYEEDLWIEGASHLFEVGAGFPRVTPATAGQGVRSVQYSIDLAACAPFAVESGRITLELERM